MDAAHRAWRQHGIILGHWNVSCFAEDGERSDGQDQGRSIDDPYRHVLARDCLDGLVVKVADSIGKVLRGRECLADFCRAHLVIAPVCASEETAAPVMRDPVRRNQACADPHDEDNPAIGLC